MARLTRLAGEQVFEHGLELLAAETKPSMYSALMCVFGAVLSLTLALP